MDLQQVMLSNLLVSLDKHTNARLDEDMLRHMVLNSIRASKMKFYSQYNELVIACDARNGWRKTVFPYYKAHRKAARSKIDLDWTTVFSALNKIRVELKENFPYPVIEVEEAEADDIIATLVFQERELQNILILSSDKDFIQLHGPSVKQYDPVRKKYIHHDDPTGFLREHILKGDAGDGIPNVLSNDNCFVVGERQRTLSSKKLQWMLNSQNIESELPLNIQRNYHRNKNLIDLSMIPNGLAISIAEEFTKQSGKDRSKLMSYFMKHRLKELMVSMSDF